MKVLALTADPSLEAALNMMEDWDILSVSDVETASERADRAEVMLIGLGILSDGMERAVAARAAGVTLPVVVVGEGEPPEGSTITVVQRPFSLDDLRDAVIRAKPVPGADLPSEPDPVAEEPATEDAAPEDVAEPGVPETVTPPTTGAAEVARKPQRVEPVSDPDDDLGDLDLAEVQVDQPAGPSLTLVPPPVEDVAEAPPERPAPEDPSDPEPARREAQRPEPQPPAQPERRPEPTRQTATPAPQRPAPPERPQPAAPPAPAASAPPPRPEPPEQARRPLSRRERKKQQKRGRQDAPHSPMEAKLASGAKAARELAELLHHLPMLRDASTLASALIDEVVDRFKPKVAVAYIRRGDSFHVVADENLSNAERKLVLPKGHGIFQEIGDDPDSILIAPVDLAKGIVSGIAGARTEALLIGPVSVEGRVVGLIVVGRDDFDDSDLDVLDELVREAAPGVAVAQLIGDLKRPG